MAPSFEMSDTAKIRKEVMVVFLFVDSGCIFSSFKRGEGDIYVCACVYGKKKKEGESKSRIG